MKRMSPSLEDYLEAVFKLTNDDTGVRTTDIAAELGVSKASVNKQLDFCPTGLCASGTVRSCLSD